MCHCKSSIEGEPPFEGTFTDEKDVQKPPEWSLLRETEEGSCISPHFRRLNREKIPSCENNWGCV